MDHKKAFEKFASDHGAFIKTTVRKTIDKGQKAELNRKGNMLFNRGDIETAKRIFFTTGYSDGMSRVGDYYMSKNRIMEAIQMYWAAPDRRKLEPLLERLAGILQSLIKEGGKNA